MNLKRGELLSMMAAAMAVTAIAIDAMLPAFGEIRAHYEFPPDATQTSLIVTVFIAALGVGQLIYGPLADRFGRKPILTLGLGIYLVAGIAATFAPSFGFMLVARAIWGLGSAAPRVVSQAILRDRFRGDELTRAMSLVIAIFLIVPTLAPLVGQFVLGWGSWRYTFAIGPVFAFAVLIWSRRLDETLEPSNRRSIQFREVLGGFATVLRNRTALAGSLSLALLSGAFLPYLGSAERIYSNIYDRGDEFALWFAANSVVVASWTLVTERVVAKKGARWTTNAWLTGLVMFAAAFVLTSVTNGGVPGFFVFFAVSTVVLALETAMTPLLTSAALNDLGHVAGTAASTVGAFSLLGGAALSEIINTSINDTVTPFAVGFLVAGLATSGLVVWSRSGGQRTAAATPPTPTGRDW